MPNNPYATYYNNAPQTASVGYQNFMSSDRMALTTGRELGKIKPMEYSQAPNPYAGAMPYVGAGLEALTGGIDLFSSARSAIDQYRDMDINSPETEVNGVPTYAGVADLQNTADAIDPNEAGKGLGLQGLATGAKAGSGLFAVNPLVGGIATGVGAIIGGVAGLFGRNKAREEAEMKKREADSKFMLAQQGYNEDVGDYYTSVDQQRSERQGQINEANRIYGMRNYNDPFRSIV
jgi:hypothetical protein